MTEQKHHITFSLFGLIILIVPLVMVALTSVAAPHLLQETLREGRVQFPLAIVGFTVSLAFGVFYVRTLFIQILRQLYDLSEEEAQEFVRLVMIGLPQRKPLHPIWRVQEGRAMPDGPATMQEIGGPGFLSVGHDSAVVTSRLGALYRVIGPGFHVLDSFEKVWDVIDLRPQRRAVHVEMMTRDGIPISCDASIRFRIDDGGQEPTSDVPYPFDEQAVVTAATIQRRKAGGVAQDWTGRIAGGSLDGAIRNRLEKYNLDEFLASSEDSVPPITQLEDEIFAAVRADGEGMGIIVEQVQLGPIQPDAEDVSRQWMEAWQTEWQSFAAQQITEGEVYRKQLIERTRVQTQVELITGMVPIIQRLHEEGGEEARQVLLLRFLNVMQTMADQESIVRHLMFQQAGYLQDVIAKLYGHEQMNQLFASEDQELGDQPALPSSP
ncbi:MAG: SPFH domain-containing protein [Anaerolineales bacterium]